MAFLRYAVPALAIAGNAYAQTSSCTVSATTTITNVADAPTACSTFSGSIAVASDAGAAVYLDGIVKILGNLIIPDAANISSITATTLESISGSFEITSGTILNVLDLPALTTVGAIDWITLGPSLTTLTAPISDAPSITIQDTYLTSLSGITVTTATTVNIANNGYLTNLSLPLTSVTTLLSLSGNGDGSTTASFPDLVSVGTIDIRNVSSLSIPKLANATDLFSITGNTFTSLSIPNLTKSDGFAVDNNPSMTAFALPAYTASGAAFSFQNNTDFVGNITLPVLKTVVGAATFLGSFDALSIPELTSIQGAVVIGSTVDIEATCEHFDSISGNDEIIQGTETCYPTTEVNAAATSTGTSTSSSTSSSSSSTSTKKSAGMLTAAPASAFTLFGALAAGFEVLALLF